MGARRGLPKHDPVLLRRSGRSVQVAMTGFQRLCLAACVVVFGLIVLGGVVRATDSGLGCPDWPRCHGSFIPKWETHTMIEWSHRATASIAGFLILGVLIGAWRSYRHTPAILYPAIATFVLLFFQAWLGRETVLNDLPEEVVAVHLATAFVILSLLILITMTAFSIARPSTAPRTPRNLAGLATVLAGGTYALAIIGSYVSGAGYSLSCSGWPLCNGQLIPNGGTDVQTIFAHRMLALLVSVVLVSMTWMAWRNARRDRTMALLLTATSGIFVLQSIIGAANIWTQLANWVAAVHLACAALLWVTVVLVNMRAHRLFELLPRRSHAHSNTDLAGATQ